MLKKVEIKNRKGLKMSIRLNIEESNTKLVFLEHGLSSRKEYPHMLVLEEMFAKHGYNVVNFDATNSLNESESSPEGITVSGHCEDLEDVVAWAKTQNFYIEPFALAGSSLGAVSVVRFAGKFPNLVNLLIPCAFPYYEKNGGLGSPQVEGIKKNGYYDKVSRSTGRVLHMTTSYVEDMENLDLSPYIEKITADTFIVIGDKDTDRHLENSKALFEMLKCKKNFVLLERVPHDLANTPETKATFSKAIDDILKNYEIKKSETSKPRLFRQKNAEFCINTKHCKYKTLTKNELYGELKYKYLEKSNISQEKMDKHILRGAADILQISKDILNFLDIDYPKLLVDIKIMNASKQKIVEQFKETAKQIQSAEKKYLYKKIVKICSCIISLAKLSSHTLQDIEEERKAVENKDGTYLDGILIWENDKM